MYRKWLVWIGVAIALALGIYGIAKNRQEQRQSATTTDLATIETPELEIDETIKLSDVDTTWDQNPIVARQKFGKKRIIFTGLVTGIEETNGQIAIGTILPATICYMKSSQPEFTELVIGRSKVKLLGKLRKKGRLLEMEDCVLMGLIP